MNQSYANLNISKFYKIFLIKLMVNITSFTVHRIYFYYAHGCAGADFEDLGVEYL